MASIVHTSFKQELLAGTHVFGTDTFKAAMFTSTLTPAASDTAYSTTNEASGTGYTAGGYTLSSVTTGTSSTTAYVDAADVSSSTTTLTFRYIRIYNSSKSNKLCVTLDMGSDQTVTAGTLAIEWPAAGTAALFTIA
jgi:hypothetical protein